MKSKYIKKDVKNVVLYLRFSSNKQNETSIEGQRKVCLDFADSKGYVVTEEYIDREKSASKDIEKRTSFLEMIEDAKKGRFDAVLVYKMDRFSRNTYETAHYMHVLEERGISLLTAIEGGNGDTPEDKLIRQVMIGFSAYYSEELSQKTVRGMRIIASKGQVPGGNRLYGYNIVDKKYVPNEKEAPIVKEIFQRVLKGEPIKDIADDLSARGVIYRKNKFNTQNISQLLTFRGYLGEVNFQDIRVEHAHEALVSYEDFEKVQNRPKCIRHSKYDDWRRPLFSGKIFCGECGKRMTGASGKARNGELFYYYRCKNKDCTLPYIPRIELNTEIMNVVFDFFYNEEFFKDVLKEAHEIVKGNNKAIDDLLEKNKKEEEKTKEEIANLIMYSTGNDLLSFLKDKIDDKKTYLTYLAKEREELENKKEINDDLVDNYAKKLNLFKKWFDLKSGGASYKNVSGITAYKEDKTSRSFFKKAEMIFAELVEKIEVFEDKSVNLVLKIDDDLNKVFEKNHVNFNDFSLVLPQKSAKFDEIEQKNKKIKNSPQSENSKRVTTIHEEESADSLNTKWPPRQESNPQPLGS